ASATSCFAVGAVYYGYLPYEPLIERWDGTMWAIVPGPQTSESNVGGLVGVSCASTTSCFAVGGDVIEHWNGTQWSLAPTGLGSDAYLARVSCTTRTSCFAVGTTAPVQTTLVERWDGTNWSRVPSPDSPGAQNTQLIGVSCTNSTKIGRA